MESSARAAPTVRPGGARGGGAPAVGVQREGTVIALCPPGSRLDPGCPRAAGKKVSD